LFSKLLGRLRGSQVKQERSASAARQPPESPPPDDRSRAEQLIAQGNDKEDAGDLLAAVRLYQEAVHVAPTFPKALLNLGIGLAAQGALADAAAAYESGLAQEPGHPFLNYNFAHLAYRQGDLAAARELAQRAVAAKPDFVEARVLLSNAHDDLGETAAALDAIDHAIALQPALAGAHLNRARLLRNLERFDEALASARRAAEIEPGSLDPSLMASLYGHLGFAQEALEFSRKAAKAQPDGFLARSRELFYSNFNENGRVEALFEAHRALGALLEQSVAPAYENLWHGAPDAQRKLRLGFVSADFYRHPVSMFLIALLEHIDRSQFEVCCYSNNAKVDPATEALRAASDGWVQAESMSAAQLAQRVHQDATDILVDLSGHSGTPTLAAFAEKPAPVAMTWLGYLNTTGLLRIDYRLCDERTDPASTQRFNTEQLLPFSASQWCYRPFIQVDAARNAPSSAAGFVTFGSFNNSRKISEAMCRRWARLLRNCDGSRLLLADISSDAKRAAIAAVFAEEGVAPHRLQFAPRADLAGYYRLYDSVDISLDTFPYGGATTTLDSLWMGVPVICAPGELPVSRSASSILELLGLRDWIAPSIDDYVTCAVERARDLAAIQQLRTSLRPALLRSSLMDEPGFTRDFERAMRAAWTRHCASRS